MAITHFLNGPHLSLVNKFNTTRKTAMENWFKYQCTYNPQLLLRDDDLQKASDKLESREREREERDCNKCHRYD